MEKEIVVARYMEDLENLTSLSPHLQDATVTVYNKGRSDDRYLSLPNVGKCDHTYMYHIVNRYDSLADVTVFVPASSYLPHKKWRLLRILKEVFENNRKTYLMTEQTAPLQLWMLGFLKKSEYNTTASENVCSVNTVSPATPRPFANWYKHHLEDVVGPLEYPTLLGIFATSKETIRRHPRKFYEQLLIQLENDMSPEAGFFLERSYHSIFRPAESEMQVLSLPLGVIFLWIALIIGGIAGFHVLINKCQSAGSPKLHVLSNTRALSRKRQSGRV
jgi:hypothetical protein